MKRLFIAVGLLAVLGLPAIASAHRPAVRAEKEGILFHARDYSTGRAANLPRSTPLKCFVVDIATVVKGSRWAGWTFSRYAYANMSNQRRCNTGNGWSIYHKIRGRWNVLWSGDEGYPPTHTTHYGSSVYPAVPRAIAKDVKAGLSY